jgi:hypothetical protein
MALVDLGVIRCRDAQHFPIACGYLQIATHSAVGTDRSSGISRGDGLGLEDIRYGRGWTGLGTGATTYTVRLHKGLVDPLDDAGVEASSCHAEHEFTLDFVAGPHTSVAIDALGHVGGHVGMTQVLFSVEVVLTFRIANISYPNLGCNRLQFTIAIDLACQAVEGVVREDEFDDVFSKGLDLFTAGENVLSLADRGMARSHGPPGSVSLHGDIYTAYPTGTEGIQVWGITQGRHQGFSLISFDEGKYRLSLMDLKWLVIDKSVFHIRSILGEVR